MTACLVVSRELSTLSYGAGTETRTYNSLMQMTSQSVPGYMNMTYTYTAGQNNGRIASSVDAIAGENTTYTYDALNRLTGASNSLWSDNYSYDGFGNLLSKMGSGGGPWTTAYFDANNHQYGVSYDGNGNTTPLRDNTYHYTVENRYAWQNTGDGAPYTQIQNAYDPSGKRVMTGSEVDPYNQYTGSAPTYNYNFYGITGQRLTTVTCSAVWNTVSTTCSVSGQSAYFRGKMLESNGVTVVTDRLGSVRANTQGGISPTTRTGKSERAIRTGEISGARTSGIPTGRTTRTSDITMRIRGGS